MEDRAVGVHTPGGEKSERTASGAYGAGWREVEIMEMVSRRTGWEGGREVVLEPRQ